jgi:hypothetical protein
MRIVGKKQLDISGPQSIRENGNNLFRQFALPSVKSFHGRLKAKVTRHPCLGTRWRVCYYPVSNIISEQKICH